MLVNEAQPLEGDIGEEEQCAGSDRSRQAGARRKSVPNARDSSAQNGMGRAGWAFRQFVNPQRADLMGLHPSL